MASGRNDRAGGDTACLLPWRTGFNPRPINFGFSQVGIVLDDATGRRVFSVVSGFPARSFRHCSILTSLHSHRLSRLDFLALERLDNKFTAGDMRTENLRGGTLARTPDHPTSRPSCHRAMRGGDSPRPTKYAYKLLNRSTPQTPAKETYWKNTKLTFGKTVFDCRTTHPDFDLMKSTQLLASPQGKSGSIPGGVAPRFSRVLIVPDDAAGKWVFSEISHFTHPCIPALLHTYLTSPSSVLKTPLSTFLGKLTLVDYANSEQGILAYGSTMTEESTMEKAFHRAGGDHRQQTQRRLVETFHKTVMFACSTKIPLNISKALALSSAEFSKVLGLSRTGCNNFKIKADFPWRSRLVGRRVGLGYGRFRVRIPGKAWVSRIHSGRATGIRRLLVAAPLEYRLHHASFGPLCVFYFPVPTICGEHSPILRTIWGTKKSRQELYERVEPISSVMRKRRLRFGGHLMRMNDNRFTKKIWNVTCLTVNSWMKEVRENWKAIGIMDQNPQATVQDRVRGTRTWWKVTNGLIPGSRYNSQKQRETGGNDLANFGARAWRRGTSELLVLCHSGLPAAILPAMLDARDLNLDLNPMTMSLDDL
ncbi:hypothetical protein PR048_017416 [Dryococelus australis]|uniref:Uncharacterized protein n=1 Tax=Dryococelus australis TaxID=614101 RepID=A0ABQ9HA29_9NEOP|nr:hypothetical protein PR048_017416 [Dryococelus australis]